MKQAKSIWKYPLSVVDTQTIEVPQGARFLSVQEQNGTLSLWAIVSPDEPKEKVRIHIFGTGSDASRLTSLFRYLGTAQSRSGNFVWHCFLEQQE